MASTSATGVNGGLPGLGPKTGDAAEAGVPDFTTDHISSRDQANVARSASVARVAANYQPLEAGIVHFFGYGQSLSLGFYGDPVLSTTQPFDNLMIGQATRAAENSDFPATTSWVPVGAPGANGTYPFLPMVATDLYPHPKSQGETPGEGALNFLRQAYLQDTRSSCQPGLPFCADQLRHRQPDDCRGLVEAATCVKTTAESLGLSYQVGGVIWTQGEQDGHVETFTASYLVSLQALQQSFLTEIVEGVAGQPADVVVRRFCHQPNSSGVANPVNFDKGRNLVVYQALLDWATTPGSNFYMAGPVYQYPNHNIHLTANSYRWHANQVSKAMVQVLLYQMTPLPLVVTSAAYSGTTVLVDLNVPVPPIMPAAVYSRYVDTVYPNLGFILIDSLGAVPILSVTIVGEATIQIVLSRTLASSPVLQAGWNQTNYQDWGANFCDSDAAVAGSTYVFTPGEQDPGEDIASWNGTPLIGNPYALNNYLALGQVPISTV